MNNNEIEKTLTFYSDYPYTFTNVCDGEYMEYGVIVYTYDGDSKIIPPFSFDNKELTGIFISDDDIDMVIDILKEFKK